MDLPVELTDLLKVMNMEGKKLAWDLQVNPGQTTLKLIWKAPEPAAKEGKPSQAQKKKPSPSTRKRNARRLAQYMETRIKAVEKKTETAVVDTQTPSRQQQSVETNTVTTPKRNSGTQDRPVNYGIPLTPTKYGHPTDNSWKPVKKRKTIRSPYIPDKYCERTKYTDGTTDLSPEFEVEYDIDNPEYDSDTALTGYKDIL